MTTLTSNSPPVPTDTDIPITIEGYVTNPTLVGYQILTNYESTYWAPLVGNNAWRLYEVLRSYCHKDNNRCYPSINLLLAILSIKDRSVLIGRRKAKKVGDKTYYYPGLIEILQEHNLVIAEVAGEGPKMRYTFHVHLTPGLLSDIQLQKLPEILQTKHAQLLERCEEEKRKLLAKKRPPKITPEVRENGSTNGDNKGIGNSNTPLGNSNTPSWNFQGKQQPINTTHKTKAARSTKNNNNKGDEEIKQNSVVVALVSQGISEDIALQLAENHTEEDINEKITYLEFLLEKRPEAARNPCGWLRSAIENDYAKPDGFMTKEEREQEKDKYTYAAGPGPVHQDQMHEQDLDEKYGISDEDKEIWRTILDEIHYTTQPGVYALISDAHILELTDNELRIGLHREEQRRDLQHPNIQAAISRVVNRILGRSVELSFVILNEN